MQNGCCSIGCFFNNSGNVNTYTLDISVNDFMQISFTAELLRYAKLTADWSLTSIKLTEKRTCIEVSLSSSGVTWTLLKKVLYNEVTF